ncbi:hypothetical protein J1614_002029 [Plenodomus biglobosus]|nr:hypothetical protein J1614_002029 [Plenodomus biglobosus]
MSLLLPHVLRLQLTTLSKQASGQSSALVVCGIPDPRRNQGARTPHLAPISHLDLSTFRRLSRAADGLVASQLSPQCKIWMV